MDNFVVFFFNVQSEYMTLVRAIIYTICSVASLLLYIRFLLAFIRITESNRQLKLKAICKSILVYQYCKPICIFITR